MERTERILHLLGDLDDALIVDAAPAATVKKPVARKKRLSIAACFCLAAVIGIAAWRMDAVSPIIDDGSRDHPAQTTKYPPAETVMTASADDDPLGLNSGYFPAIRTSAYQYNSFSVGALTYTCQYTNTKISPVLLGERLGEAEAVSRNQSDRRRITYYRIAGIAERCAVAVLFDGEKDIYVYLNTKYRPVTMGDLFADMSLGEYLCLGEVTVTHAEEEQLHTAVYRVDAEMLMTHLFADMMTVEVHAVNHTTSNAYPATYPERVTIEAHMNMFGYDWIDIWVSRNGYLVLELFHSYYVFDMDDARLERFLTALEQVDGDPVRTVEELPPVFDMYLNPTVADLYRTITVGGITYTCRTVEYGIDADRVGEMLGETKIAAPDSAPTVTYYRLVGVSEAFGIAVKFPSDPTYYSYHNTDYRPDTLGDLIDDMGLATYLRLGDPTVIYREGTVTQTAVFMNADPAPLWQYLLSGVAAENIVPANGRKPAEETVRVEIPLRIPLFANSNEFTLRVTEDGCLRLDLLDIYCVFRLEAGQFERYLATLIHRDPDVRLSVRDSALPGRGGAEGADCPTREYRSLEIDGIVYTTADKTVDASDVGEQLGTAVAIGYDPDSGMITHAPVTCFAVRDTSSLSAVAVCFTDKRGTSYYLYRNTGYLPRTLGELLAQNDWRENVRFDGCSTVVGGNSIKKRAVLEFSEVDAAQIWSLFADGDAPNVFKSDGVRSTGNAILIDAELTLSDGREVPLDITVGDLGYLKIIVDGDRNRPLCFDIGKERVGAFVEYIMTECTDNVTVSSGLVACYAGESFEEAVDRLLAEKFDRLF